MKLLVISAAFPPMRAGEADHMLHLCQHLAAAGLEVHVLTTKKNTIPCQLPFRVYPIMQDWSWKDLRRLQAFLKRLSPDAVLLKYIGWIYDYHPMITFAPTLAKAMIPSLRFVTQFANAEGAEPATFSFSTRLIRKVISRWAGDRDVDYSFGTLLRDSDQLIVFSDVHRSRLAERLTEVNHKSVLIPPPPIMRMSSENNGASRHRGRARLGIWPGDFLFVYFGYVYPGKGVETLLKAFQTIVKKRTHARLLILGGFIARSFPDRPRYAEEISGLPKHLGIDHKVIWFGEYAWDSDQASSCLRAADACVLPVEIGIQLNNSSLAGAAAHGVPIITTRGNVLEKAFVDRENVLLCLPGNAESLADGMETLMDGPELALRLKRGALQLYEDWFSWSKATDCTLAALKG
jgi:glycosyltransferase involved in cell wall biosynthesis